MGLLVPYFEQYSIDTDSLPVDRRDANISHVFKNTTVTKDYVYFSVF